MIILWSSIICTRFRWPIVTSSGTSDVWHMMLITPDVNYLSIFHGYQSIGNGEWHQARNYILHPLLNHAVVTDTCSKHHTSLVNLCYHGWPISKISQTIYQWWAWSLAIADSPVFWGEPSARIIVPKLSRGNWSFLSHLQAKFYIYIELICFTPLYWHCPSNQ